MTRIEFAKDMEVQVATQGVLDQDTVNETPSGTGDTYVEHEVPTGKRWVVKGWNLFESLTGTISWVKAYIAPNGSDSVLFANPTKNEPTLLSNDLVLQEGAKVRMRYNLSAYTSGTVSSSLLYVEHDA